MKSRLFEEFKNIFLYISLDSWPHINFEGRVVAQVNKAGIFDGK